MSKIQEFFHALQGIVHCQNSAALIEQTTCHHRKVISIEDGVITAEILQSLAARISLTFSTFSYTASVGESIKSNPSGAKQPSVELYKSLIRSSLLGISTVLLSSGLISVVDLQISAVLAAENFTIPLNQKCTSSAIDPTARTQDLYGRRTEGFPCPAETTWLEAPRSRDVRTQKYARRDCGWAGGHAILSRDGSLAVDSRAVCNASSGALHAGLYIVGVDSKGRALFVSDFMRVPTACGHWDLSCPSDVTQVFTQKIDPNIAQYVDRLDLFISGQNQPRDWQNRRENVLEAVRTYDDLPPAVKSAIMSGG